MCSAGSVGYASQSAQPSSGPCLAFLLHWTHLGFRSCGRRHRPGCQGPLALCSGCSSHPTRCHSRVCNSTWGSTVGRGVTPEAYLIILTPCLQQQHGSRGQQRSLLAVRQVSAAANNSAKQTVWEAYSGCRWSWADGGCCGLPTIRLHCVSGELTAGRLPLVSATTH